MVSTYSHFRGHSVSRRHISRQAVENGLLFYILPFFKSPSNRSFRKDVGQSNIHRHR
uniref:Uncharacterized protein n=1 Tax=Human betaherpesvirus 6 TaxID=10368 RepID=A0A1W6G138_9BETA|nr:hypothetical protein [Human betaherpesvirus 6]